MSNKRVSPNTLSPVRTTASGVSWAAVAAGSSSEPVAHKSPTKKTKTTPSSTTTTTCCGGCCGRSATAPTNTCVLCLENMDSSTLRSVTVVLPCGHAYHEDCFAGLQASVIERDDDEYDDDDNYEPEDRPIKCPNCNQEIRSFGKVFLNLGTSSATTAAFPTPASAYSRKAATVEHLVRSSLWSRNEDEVEMALKRIRNNLEDGTAATPSSFLLMGGHVVLLRAMERFPSKYEIQWNAARILFMLSSVRPTAPGSDVVQSHRPVLHAVEAYKNVLVAMRTHGSKHRNIFAICCAILSNLCEYNHITKQHVGKKGIQMAIQAMTRFPGDEMQVRVCGFLKTVTRDSETNLSYLAELDGIGPLVETMKRHASKHEIQSSCALMLGELALLSDHIKGEILLHGGATAISAALEKYHTLSSSSTSSRNLGVQRCCETAMNRICNNTTRRTMTTTATTTNNNAPTTT